MNPQYAPPQPFGMPPNPYEGFPNQGMPANAQQKPPQQPFSPQQNNVYPGYGMTPNQGNAPPSAIASPIGPSSQPPQNPPMHAGMSNSGFPPQPGIVNQQNSITTQHMLGAGNPGVNSVMTPASSNAHIQNSQQLAQKPISPPSVPQNHQHSGPHGLESSNPLPVSSQSGPPPQLQSQSGMPQGLPSQPPHQQGLPGQPPQGQGPPHQPQGLPTQSPHQQGLPGQPPQGQGPPLQPQGLPGQPHQGQGPPVHSSQRPGQPPQALSFPGQPPQAQGFPGQPQQFQNPQGQPQNSQGPPLNQPQSSQGLPPGQPQGNFPPRGPPQGAPPQQNFGQQPPQQGPSQPPMNQPMSRQNMSQSYPHQGQPSNPHSMPPPLQGSIVPPRQGHPGSQFPGMGAPPPGPGSPHGQGFPPPQQRMPMPPRPGTTFPNPANVDNLSGQMTGMNLNGPLPPMAANQQMNVNGPAKINQPGMPPMPGQRFPPVNGGPAPQMNGIPDPNAPRPPMQQRYPQENMQRMQGGGYPPMSSPTGAYPPQHGYPPQAAPFPAAQPSYPSAPAPQIKLDPDSMPSPVEAVSEDQRLKSGMFYTNQKGQLPPLVTTDFVTVDQGNTNPRFMRSTMYYVPVSADMMKQTAVPFALAISPMAELLEDEQPPPLVDFGEAGPVRCIRCKAYMCPNFQFFDGGRRFLCLLCKATTEVPGEYFQHLDHTGLRVDRFERAELMLGTYDIVATKEYCRDNVPPKPPALIFLIDVSYNNVKSGLVSLLCAQMKSFLFNLPKERGQAKSSLRVGFVTYNSSVHFYNINPNLGQPQMLVVGDIHEMFMPLLDGFLADVEESEALIDMLMQQIPAMFADTRETETVLAPAIQAGLEAFKAAGCAGKLLVFHSSLPSLEAPGKLKNRDDRKLLATDKEKTVLTPQCKIYNDLGQDCVLSGCSVDLYIFNNSYIDLATIGQVARLTGGEIYKYTYFQADLDGDRVVADVRSNVKRLCAFDAIMRVRTSAGVRPTDFHGHFFMSNTTDIELASIDPDKAVAVEIKHDDKLSEEDGVYIQTALLYTSLSGQRRIRILNLGLKACSQMTDVYRSCELDTIMNFFLKQAVYKLLDATPKAIRENYTQRSAQILACYRKHCASPTSAGQLILPECMKLLPLYMNCMLKCDAVSGGSDMTIDDRWFTMAAVSTMDVPSSAVYLYPRLVPLVDIGDEMPALIRCSADRMKEDGVYLLDNGIYMFLWLGLAVPSDWVAAVFGVPSSSQVDTEKNRLPVLDNQLSEKIREYIGLVGSSRHRSMRLTVVRQRDKMELVMKHFLVEDKGLDGSASYVEFLCHLHKEIRSIIS